LVPSPCEADLGHLERSEAAREGELRLVGHILIAKNKDRMLLERRARLLVSGVVRGDLGKRHAAQLGRETRTQRDDLHRRGLRRYGVYLKIFHQNRPAGKEARHAWEPGPLRAIRVDCAMFVGPLTLQHSPSKLT
jgi:hypothetical protein